MLRFLNKTEKEELQRSGYMYEHLLCFYSMASDRTAIFNETFPVFLNNYNEADIVFFGIGDKKEQTNKCLLELSKLPLKIINIITPVALEEPNIMLRYVDWDYHINIKDFDFDLKGNKHKRIRYIVKQFQKQQYHTKIGRKLTPSHLYILSRHLSRHLFDVWDFEEILFLDKFFREHKHGFMIEVYKEDRLIGFDVIDFFEDNRIMVVPLGIYLEAPRISDFLMYENLKYAKENHYEWLDIGLTCGNIGLQHFKEKWNAVPKFKIIVQKMILNNDKIRSK